MRQCDILCSADEGKHRKAEGRGIKSVRIAVREVPGEWPSLRDEDSMYLRRDDMPFVEYFTLLESFLLRLM